MRPTAEPSLDLDACFAGRVLVVVGGTGFLGKVFWALLLDRVPQVGHIYLLVRPKGGLSEEERFWSEVARSEVLEPLRERHGAAFEAFLKEKITPIAGDVAHLYCGVGAPLRDKLRGRVAAVVNAAGVVEFDPPLDSALGVNAFGVQNLVSLARDLGDCPVFHTSTCFVAGSKTGFVDETDPLEYPFPRADQLGRDHFDADREIRECLEVVEEARRSADAAFRQNQFLDQAKRELEEQGGPPYGVPLERQVAKVRRRYIEGRLAELGKERAQSWGWANTYTYTKSLGEQIVARSGLPFLIARPAIIESSFQFPFPGWNEGVNTSAPLIYVIRSGQPQFPGGDFNLDIIPCDMVAAGMLVSLAELLDGSHQAVYQYGSSDTNPVSVARIFELTGLYKRRYYQSRGRGFLDTLQAHYEGALISSERFEREGPKRLARWADQARAAVDKASVGAFRPLLSPASQKLKGFARQQRNVAKVLSLFAPFTAEYDYTFRCDNTRSAYRRLSPADQARLPWNPEAIDWRSWFLDVHIPGLERWVFPVLEKRLKRSLRAPEPHTTLVSLLEHQARRAPHGVALCLVGDEGEERLSFGSWHEGSLRLAEHLVALGVKPNDRVVLCGANKPSWAIAFFAILCAGATVVPLDPQADASAAETIAGASGAQLALVDDRARARFGEALAACELVTLDTEVARAVAAGRLGSSPPSEEHPPPADPASVALLVYTSGTTGTPKGVMLSHHNLTCLVASLAPLFPLEADDRLLSVLPLHHTFELTCGLLLPLSRGARVAYLQQVTRARLVEGLSQAGVTAMVGVPALWESLEREILGRVRDRGPLAGSFFDFGLALSRSLGRSMGVDVGRLLFGSVHAALGGRLRVLVSGGAALPESTHKLFAGLGLHLAEGYGLTEASPVVSVAVAGPRARPGDVGRPIPGLEMKIVGPDERGVGEVAVRGPTVMAGYAEDPESTSRVVDNSGWLHTGDLGRVDGRGRLSILGRHKEVIVPATGKNVYPDDVEAQLASLSLSDAVSELCVLGVSNQRGREVVALVGVLAEGASALQAERSLRAASARLSDSARPAIIQIWAQNLPRTATGKVRRGEVRQRLEERARAESATHLAGVGASTSIVDITDQRVVAAVAAVGRCAARDVRPEQTLRGDLGFDSLQLLELLVALEVQLGAAIDSNRLAECETVDDLQVLARASRGAGKLPQPTDAGPGEERSASVSVPEAVQIPAKRILAEAQKRFYGQVMRTEVVGRAHIPANRNTLVIANHCSHLDMGLVKYALGDYGREMVALAAQDYFFERGRWRRAYFENFTHVVPLSRSGSLRQSLRQAGQQLDGGKVVLLFPEGTRTADGQLQALKPLAAHLALTHGVDVLPVWLDGTFSALPRGAKALLRRSLKASIGAPLEAAALLRFSEGLSGVDRTRAVTNVFGEALQALRDGKAFDLSQRSAAKLAATTPTTPSDISHVFEELRSRFTRGQVDRPVSYYLALGQERWTLHVSADSCRVDRGRTVEQADCVLKTSPALFRRIVYEAYSPSPAEFLSGQVKSNNVALLVTFQKVFQLVSDAQQG